MADFLLFQCSSDPKFRHSLWYTVISGVWYCTVRDRPKELLRVLIILIRTDFAALRGGTGPLSARYGRVLLGC